MKMRAMTPLRYLQRWRGRTWQAAILVYHRVADVRPDPQLLCVTPAHFAAHIAHLKRHYHPISLSQLARGLDGGELRDRSVVITFDDGYTDNLYAAAPVLERFDVPATVFVASGFVDRDEEFASDVLERCLLERRALPRALTLTVNGRTRSWPIDAYDARSEDWNVARADTPTLRHRCYRDLHGMLRPIDHRGRQDVLGQLLTWAGCPRTGRETHRVMTAAELRQLAATGLIEIGAHGAHHLVLARQPVDVQRREIFGSRQDLEARLGRPVRHFAYSYGSEGDANAETIRLAREAGYETACANVASTITAESDPHWLPRHLVRDWDEATFAEELAQVFDG